MEKLRYIAYARKSTEEDERQALSIDSQKDNIFKRYGEELNIIDCFEESMSASEPYKRPVLQKILDMIDKGEADGIVAWHADRLSRNEIDASAISYRIRKGVIKDLKLVSGITFENTPDGIMMLQFSMSQSQYFSAKLSKDIRRGNEKKREMGQLTGRAPEGYLNHRTSMSGRGEATVIKDPDRFPIIRRAFDLFLTGEYSVPAILTIMNKEWGYETLKRRKMGGGGISRTTLYNIFRNVKYAGLIPDPYNPEHLFPASYPAMITPEEYDKVQSLLGRRGLPRLVTRKQFALRGFIRCGDCDCTVTAQSKDRRLTNGGVNTHTYYHCTGKRKGCTQKSIYVKEDDLYAQLLELLDNYELVPRLHDWAMEAFRDFAEQEVTERNNVQAMQNKAITNTQTQLDKLLDMATRELIDDKEYKAKNAALKADLKRLQEEQSDTTHRVKNWYEIATSTFEKLLYAGERFKEGDVANKKDILLAIGENPVLMNGHLEITAHDWLQPVAKSAKGIRAELEKVRTMPQQIQKASEDALRTEWCWGRDSNPRRRMPTDLQSVVFDRFTTPAIIQL